MNQAIIFAALYQLNIKRILIEWLSVLVLRILTEEQLDELGKVEEVKGKLDDGGCHLDFNITCINNMS